MIQSLLQISLGVYILTLDERTAEPFTSKAEWSCALDKFSDKANEIIEAEKAPPQTRRQLSDRHCGAYFMLLAEACACQIQ